ncbi:hypothetical protein V3C99_016390 [Haemonchus contortus]
MYYDDESVKSLPSDRKELLDGLMKEAISFFESALKVERSEGTRISASCEGSNYINDLGKVICERDCVPKCGKLKIPPEHNIFLPCSCISIACPTDFKPYEGVLKEADLALFVSVSKDESCRPQVYTHSEYCGRDLKTNRPVGGHIGICPDAFKSMLPRQRNKWLSTIKREIVRMLVFAPYHLKRFPTAKLPPKEEEQENIKLGAVIPGVLEKLTREDWETKTGQIKRDVHMIVTKNVRNEAREYFKCSSLEGAELEDQGGPGSIGSQWETRILENEAMSGGSLQVHAISRITLALFEDSGWYQVDYSKADEMTFGKGLGCDFVKKSCLSWMKSQKGPSPFCTRESDLTCSADRKSKAICNFAAGMKVPPEYDYNVPGLFTDDKGNPVEGGGENVMADYCPYYSEFEHSSTQDRDSRCTYKGNAGSDNYTLEDFSPSSRCFKLKGGVKIEMNFKRYTYSAEYGCYSTMCEEGRLKIKTAHTEYATCEPPEEPIHIEKDVSGVGIVSMNIVCPPCQELCSDCAPAKQTERKGSDSSKSSENANVGETKNPEDEKNGNQSKDSEDEKGGDGSKDPEGMENSGNSGASVNGNIDKKAESVYPDQTDNGKHDGSANQQTKNFGYYQQIPIQAILFLVIVLF